MKSILDYAEKNNVIENLIPLAALSQTNIKRKESSSIFKDFDARFEAIEQYRFLFLFEGFSGKDLNYYCITHNVDPESCKKVMGQIKDLEKEYSVKANYITDDEVVNHMLCAWILHTYDNLHIVNLLSGATSRFDDLPVLNLNSEFYEYNLHSPNHHIGVQSMKGFVFGQNHNGTLINQAFLGLFPMLNIAKQLPEIFKVDEIDRHIFPELEISEFTYEVQFKDKRLLTLTDFLDNDTKKQFRLDLLDECLEAAEKAEESGTGKVSIQDSNLMKTVSVYGNSYQLTESGVSESLLEKLRNDIVINRNHLKILEVNQFLRKEKRPPISTSFTNDNPETWHFTSNGSKVHIRNTKELQNLLTERNINM
jgi:hypothetical protein